MATKEAVRHPKPKVVKRVDVPLDRLRPAPWNPARRVEPARLRKLMDGMDRIGLLHPITVTPDWQIVDGHRRWASARQLGWTDIECNVVELDGAEAYAVVNTAQQRLTGNDLLGVWLTTPAAVPDRDAGRFSKMAAGLGRRLCVRVYEAGMSWQVYDTCCRLARYCGRLDQRSAPDPDWMKTAADWLLRHRAAQPVRELMTAGEAPNRIAALIDNDKPPRLRTA